MEMTRSEIAARCGAAENPQKEIRILAELNGTTRKDIQDILRQETAAGSLQKISAAREARLTQLYHAGLTDGSIARYMGMTRQAVWYWRSANGLPSMYGKRQKLTQKGGGAP